jgi:shikimate kinase
LVYIICGFPGSGKSIFIQSLLKLKSGKVTPIDMDTALRDSFFPNFLNVGEFISMQGEYEFRKIESKVMKLISLSTSKENVLKALGIENSGFEKPLVVALGGGALTQENVKSLIDNNLIKLIYLKTSFEKCFNNIIKEGNLRPSIFKVAQNKDKLKILYDQRVDVYKNANITLETKDLYDGNELKFSYLERMKVFC